MQDILGSEEVGKDLLVGGGETGSAVETSSMEGDKIQETICSKDLSDIENDLEIFVRGVYPIPKALMNLSLCFWMMLLMKRHGPTWCDKLVTLDTEDSASCVRFVSHM